MSWRKADVGSKPMLLRIATRVLQQAAAQAGKLAELCVQALQDDRGSAL
jgi:hypothetical protein